MYIPSAKEVIAHAYGIDDKVSRLKFLEVQMDEVAKLNQAIWDHYSLLSCEIIYPAREAARRVCEYDWPDSDGDAVARLDALRSATHS